MNLNSITKIHNNARKGFVHVGINGIKPQRQPVKRKRNEKWTVVTGYARQARHYVWRAVERVLQVCQWDTSHGLPVDQPSSQWSVRCSNRSAGRSSVARNSVDENLLHSSLRLLGRLVFFCVGKWTCICIDISELLLKTVSCLVGYDGLTLIRQLVLIARGGTKFTAKCRPIRLPNQFWRTFRIRI